MSLAVDPWVYLPFHTPKNFLFLTATPLMALQYFLTAFRKQDQRYEINLLILLLVVRLIWILISNPSLVKSNSSLGFLITLNLTLLTFIILQISVNNGAVLKKNILFILFVIGILQSFIGMGQWYYFTDIELNYVKTAMLGTIGAANGYGLILAIGIISGIYIFNTASTKSAKLFTGTAIIMQLLALIINRSRGAFLILSIMLILVFYWQRENIFKIKVLTFLQKRLVFLSTFGGILIIAGIVLFSINLESSMGRILAWRISTPMFIKNPLFGVGYNNLAVEFLNYQAEFFQNESNLSLAYKAANLKQVHNEYLQAFCETGFAGGVLLLFIIIIPIYQLYKNRAQDKSNLFILLILLGIALHSLIDAPLHVLPILVITYTLFGLAPSSKFKLHINSRVLSYFFVILSLLFFIFLGNKTIMQYPAYRTWQKGYNCIENRNQDCAISFYKEALKSLPDKGELLFHLGSAQVINGEYSQGIDLLKEATKNFSDRNIYLSLGYGYFRLNELSEAEFWAEKGLSMFPDQLAPHLILGEIYYYKGDISKSKASLKKCINQETYIQSHDTKLIARDALELWKKFYY